MEARGERVDVERAGRSVFDGVRSVSEGRAARGRVGVENLSVVLVMALALVLLVLGKA